MSEGKKRVTFRVQPEVADKLNKSVPWGQQSMLFEAITEDLIHMFEEHEPELIISAIVSKNIKLSHIIDFDKRRKDG